MDYYRVKIGVGLASSPYPEKTHEFFAAVNAAHLTAKHSSEGKPSETASSYELARNAIESAACDFLTIQKILPSYLVAKLESESTSENLAITSGRLPDYSALGLGLWWLTKENSS